MFKLSNKIALIFGGNGYLGRQFCRALLEYGAKVYSCDVNTESSKEIKKLMKKYPKKFKLIKVDAGSERELTKLRKCLLAKEKTVDILINAATIKPEDSYLPFEKASLKGWDIGLLGNLTIPFLTIRTFIPFMKKAGGGSIINIASHYGMVGNDQRIYEGSNLHKVYLKSQPNIKRVYAHGVYNAAKGGLINFTRFLAAYYGRHNIRVNCISPGGIYHKKENKTFLKKYSGKTPLGRKANPYEINGALVFLASDASSYVTGHNLVIDGGYTIW